MSRLALALALIASAPMPAAAHCYSIWHYPQPQRCGVRINSWVSGAHELTRPHRIATPVRDIPLPGLAHADFAAGAADEQARGRLLLRAILEAPDGH